MRESVAAHDLHDAGSEARDEEVLRSLREASARWVQRERERLRVTSGASELDRLLGGGWPSGKVGELVGALSAGCTGMAMATVAAATARGEVAAWIDPAHAFDPVSARELKVDLDRVLWVRPRGEEDAVRAAELVLEVGGFTVVVLDLVEAGRRDRAQGSGFREEGRGRTPGYGVRRRRGPLRLRLARAVERAGAVALVLAERPWAGTLAGITLRFGPARVRWGEGEEGMPRWLAGLEGRAQGTGRRAQGEGTGNRAQGAGEEISSLRVAESVSPGGWGQAG